MPRKTQAPPPSTAENPTDSARSNPQPTRASKQSSKTASKPAGKHAGKTASKKPRAPRLTPEPAQSYKGKLHSAPADAPVRFEVACRAYEMYVLQRKNFTEIGRALGIDRETASKYIGEESVRRRGERVEMRLAMQDKTLNNIDEVEAYYFEKMYSPNFKGDEGRTILECQKQRTALMGLDPGIVIKDERETVNPFASIKTAGEALAILQALPDGGGGPK